MFLALNLSLAVAQGPADLNADPRLDKHVSYRAVAAPAKSAIAGLAQSADLPLAAGGNVWPEILLLNLNDVPIRDVMVRLSHATAATWILDHGTYYLSRTDADLKRREATDRGKLVEALRKEFAKQAQEVASQKPFDSASAKAILTQLKAIQNQKPNAETGNTQVSGGMDQIEKLEHSSPIGRVGARVLSHLDPEVLAQAPTRRRTVFSTSPTRMEAPLHVDLGDAIDTFAAEQGVYATEMETNTDRDRMILSRFQHNFFEADRVKQAPAKLNVIVSRLDDFMEGVGVEVQLYDSAGIRMASALYNVKTDPDFPSEKELVADPNEQKLTISPDDMTLMQVLGSVLGGKSSKVTVLPDSIRARLLQPELHEPLASFASSLLLETADTKHLNLVADLPDAYVVLGATPGFTGLPTATSILKLAMALPPSIGPVTVDDKWIEIAGGQASPGAIMGHRANRAELAQLFASASDGALTIEGLARYAYVGEGVPDDFMLLLLGPLLFPGSDVAGGDQWRTYRLIGALMHRQADASLKTGRILISSLDPDSIAQLENIIFFQRPNGLSAKIAPSGHPIWDEEPCELLPRGLPRDGYIDVTNTDREAVYSGGLRPQSVNPNQLAWNQEMQEHPDRFGGPPMYTIGSKFRVGTLRQLQLHIQLADGIAKDTSVQEQHVGHAAEIPFSQLPKEFRDQYQQQKDSFDKSNQ